MILTGDAKAKGAVAVTVRNDSGSDFNGPVTVSVLASQDAIADVADVAIATSAKPLKLKAGQTKAVKFKLALATLPQGSYTLIGAATVDNLTSSANGPSLSVQPAVVHLVNGGAAPAAKPITGGKKAALAVPLRNDGNVATTTSLATYTLIVSTDGTEAGAVFTTTAIGKLALKAATAKPQKLSVTFPAGSVPPGSYTLIVKVSADLNDTNDQVVTTLPVTFV